MTKTKTPTRPRLLIEEWLPAQAIGVECIRERATGQQPPDKRLHVWWARRPLAACRAVICAALWPDPADPSFYDGMEARFERLSDRTDLDEILQDAHLGEAWYSGVLGGVPEKS